MTMVRMLGKAGALLILLLAADAADARNLPIPHEYGKVIINNHSRRAGLAPVQFDHWLHRALYTCRLCHVDIGFAMQANATNITADGNAKGYYCGACHNGKQPFKERKVFRACDLNQSSNDRSRCERCHSVGKKVKKEYEYAVFTEKFPRRVYGDIIDWEEAEAKKLVSPVDFLEAVSIRRPALKAQEDFSITSKSNWVSDIIFSHKKHTVWNGCEVCHPEIFPSSKQGTVKYSMLEISAGQYCGLCHTKVAFPLFDCQRCHKASVR
jgi:c(7)-type cytochrome triheme protein